MKTIDAMTCIYSTKDGKWALEVSFGGQTRRFPVAGPQDAEMVIEAFEEATDALFDPQTGEIHFAYEMTSGDEEDEEDEEEGAEEDEEESEEEDEEESEEEEKTSGKQPPARKQAAQKAPTRPSGRRPGGARS